jgi:hypothetical protein
MLEIAEPWIPPELVSTAALSRLKLLAAALPAALTDRFHLECRLGSHSSRTDLILGITGDGRRILAGSNPAVAMAPELEGHPVWSGLKALFGLRQVGALPSSGPAARTWLEFDLDAGEHQRLPVPGVFAVWKRPLRGDQGWQVLWSCLEQYQRYLLGHPPSQELRRILWRCMRSLPESASIFAAGFFPSRRHLELRLCVSGLLAGQVPDYLEAIDWPGPLSACRRWMEREPLKAPGIGKTRLLHLDLGRAFKPKFGVEVNLRHNGLLRRPKDTGRYLDGLVASGLCTPPKRRGLDSWGGTQVVTLPHELWPSMVARWVNHVKVTCGQSGTARAKAYLCHGHSPYARRRRMAPVSAS